MRRTFIRAALACGLAAAAAAPAMAELALVMFEQPGCLHCRTWDREIAAKYPKTPEGEAAPLRRLDLHAPLPAEIGVKRPPQFTPTFVLLENGAEIGRIEGYPGEAFFWGLLADLIARAQAAPAPPGR